MTTKSVRSLVHMAMASSLTAILAWISIPLPISPVPISAQTLGVMVSGIFLPPKAAALSQVIYVSLGIIGLPVFSGGTSGLGVLLGPTGGYLWGFILGATIISLGTRLNHKGNRLYRALTLILGGFIAIYTLGILQLMLVTKMSLYEAVSVGMLPFILGDILKLMIVWFLAGRLLTDFDRFPFS